MLFRYLRWMSMVGLIVILVGGIVGCHKRDCVRHSAATATPTPKDSGDSAETAPTPAAGKPDSVPTAKPLHERIFVDALLINEYKGTADSCLICHSDHARDILETGHWNWRGVVTNIEGIEGETRGKKDLLNNL